jgi:hypothetical protein
LTESIIFVLQSSIYDTGITQKHSTGRTGVASRSPANSPFSHARAAARRFA